MVRDGKGRHSRLQSGRQGTREERGKGKDYAEEVAELQHQKCHLNKLSEPGQYCWVMLLYSHWFRRRALKCGETCSWGGTLLIFDLRHSSSTAVQRRKTSCRFPNFTSLMYTHHRMQRCIDVYPHFSIRYSFILYKKYDKRCYLVL